MIADAELEAPLWWLYVLAFSRCFLCIMFAVQKSCRPVDIDCKGSPKRVYADFAKTTYPPERYVARSSRLGRGEERAMQT